MKARRGVMALLGETLTQHPARVVEFLFALGIPLLLWLVGRRTGGDLWQDTGVELALRGSYLLGALWVVWWMLQKQGVELSRGVLWTLPLVLFAGLSAEFHAVAPWRSVPFFGMVWPAWLVFAIVSHSLRQRVHLYLLLVLSLVVVFLLANGTLLSGLARLSTEEWVRRMEGDVEVMRFGSFALPPPLIWCWLGTLPLAALVLGMPRFAGYVRIAAGGYVLFGLFQLFQLGADAGLLVAGISVLSWPLFWRPRWKTRLRLGLAMGVLVALVGSAYVVAAQWQTSVAANRSSLPGMLDTAHWSAAVETWKQAPLAGNGLGTFSLLAESREEALAGAAAWGPRASLLQILSDLGLVGLGLSLVALGGTVFCWWREWLREPFFPRDREAEYRFSHGAGAEPSQRSSSRRHREHRLKRTTSRKVILGGIVSGMGALLLYSCFESNWTTGAPLLLLAILGGAAERLGGAGAVRIAGGRSRWRWAMALVAAVLAAVSLRYLNPVTAVPELAAADAALAPYVGDDRLAFEQPAGIYAAGRHARWALELQPDNAEAWALLARAALHKEAVARESLEAIGEEVIAAAERAVDLYPKRGYAQYLLAEGHVLRGDPPAEIEDTFERAVALAPSDLRIRLAWARYRFRVRGDRPGALEQVRAVLARDPENPAALALQRRLEL